MTKELQLRTVLIAGGIALALSVAAFFAGRHFGKRLDAMSSTETVPCNALTADQVCEVVGQAQPGPEGLLKGPASGRECVWHRKKVTQHWEEWETDAKGDRRRVSRSNVVSDVSSTSLFAVRDEAGQVLVNAHGTDIDGVVKSHDERTRERESVGEGIIAALLETRDDEEIEVEEWVLPAGQRLYVRGQPTDTGDGLTMIDPGDSPYIISTRSEEELAGSARTWMRVGQIGAIVLAVVGAGLLVAGALA